MNQTIIAKLWDVWPKFFRHKLFLPDFDRLVSTVEALVSLAYYRGLLDGILIGSVVAILVMHMGPRVVAKGESNAKAN